MTRCQLKIESKFTGGAAHCTNNEHTLFPPFVIQSWESFKESLANWTYSLEPWRNSIKSIEGHFGSGVVSYFLLLKWLLLLNIPVFMISFCFISMPQLFYQASPSVNNISFAAGDLLTGGVSDDVTITMKTFFILQTMLLDLKGSVI